MHPSAVRPLVVASTLLLAGCGSLSLDGLFGGGDDDELAASGADALEAGPEGRPPSFGTPSAPVPLPVGTPLFAASDGVALFVVVDRGDSWGAIVRADEKNAPRVLGGEVYRPTGIAVDGSRVYFGNGNPFGGHTTIRSIDKATGLDPRDYFDTGTSSSAFTAVAAQGTTLAWSSKNDLEGIVRRGLSDGTGVTTLATKQGPVAAVAVAGPWVYWARNTQLYRKAATAPTEAPPELVDTRGLFTSLVSDGLDVYATSDDGTLVTTTATDGPPSVKVLGTGLMQPRGLTVDPWFVYVVATGTSTVSAVHRRSGRTVEIARGGDPYALAATSTCLWVLDRYGRLAWSVPKVAP